MTDNAAYLPEPRTTRRGRQVDEATRLNLLTPEERAELQRQQEERERRYQEEVRLRRMEIDAQFTDAYTTYRASNRYDLSWDYSSNVISYDTFFDVPSSLQPRPQPTEPSLHERFNAAVQEASRCSQRGDTLGRVAATRMANDLRRQLMQSQLFPQFV